VDNILAFSSLKKTQELGRRINREITRVRTTKDLLKNVDIDEEDTIILVDLAMRSMAGINIQDMAKHVGKIPIVLLEDIATIDLRRILQFENSKGKNCQKQLQPELHHSKSGRIDAKRVAEFFQLPLSTIAKILKSHPKTVHKTPDAVNIQGGLGVFLRIASALMVKYGSEAESRVWLNTPNPDLDNTQPLEIIKRGRCEIVADLLEDALLGHPG